jgi:antibiotic biosynthesis monooxygenase (ABM) superfamily enzyme
MSERFVLVVHLWIHPGQEAEFDAFEREAARLMARHKGRIDRAIRMTPPEGAGPRDETPYEIHVVSFPNKGAWEAYGADPDTLKLREKRSQIISRTAIMQGREAGPC